MSCLHCVSLDDLNVARNAMKFTFFRTGPLCNGGRSKSFADANCDASLVPGPDDWLGYSILFGAVFEKGFDLLEGLTNGSVRFEELPERDKKALNVLDAYLNERKIHFDNLVKVLKKDGIKETEIAAVLAVHLLGKLSSAQTYVVDKRSKGKEHCKCGCGEIINYGDTGIGHEKVWHGYLDIIMESDEGVTAAAVIQPVVKITKQVDDFNGDHVTNETQTASSDQLSEAVKNKCFAQTIVFSLLQKQRHPDFDDYLIPTILITPSDFRVIMYDAENDILLHSTMMYFLLGDSLDKNAIIILWMVLHYRLFCSGMVVSVDINMLKSGFKNNIIIHDKIYQSELKSCVASFPRTETVDDVSDGKVWAGRFFPANSNFR